VGWTKDWSWRKCEEGWQEFDCATWLHKARSLPKDEFKREVERELTGRESEPCGDYLLQAIQDPRFQLSSRQLRRRRNAGTDKSRGYCLEMICADSWRSKPRE